MTTTIAIVNPIPALPAPPIRPALPMPACETFRKKMESESIRDCVIDFGNIWKWKKGNESDEYIISACEILARKIRNKTLKHMYDSAKMKWLKTNSDKQNNMVNIDNPDDSGCPDILEKIRKSCKRVDKLIDSARSANMVKFYKLNRNGNWNKISNPETKKMNEKLTNFVKENFDEYDITDVVFELIIIFARGTNGNLNLECEYSVNANKIHPTVKPAINHIFRGTRHYIEHMRAVRIGTYSSVKIQSLEHVFDVLAETGASDSFVAVDFDVFCSQTLNNEQIEIVRMLLNNCSISEIADRTNVSQATCRKRIERIRKKLKAANQTFVRTDETSTNVRIIPESHEQTYYGTFDRKPIEIPQQYMSKIVIDRVDAKRNMRAYLEKHKND